MMINGNPTTSNKIGAKIKAPQGVKRDLPLPPLAVAMEMPQSQEDRTTGSQDS